MNQNEKAREGDSERRQGSHLGGWREGLLLMVGESLGVVVFGGEM